MIVASFGVGVITLVFGTLAAHDSVANGGMTLLQIALMAALAWQEAQRAAAQPVRRYARLLARMSGLRICVLAALDALILLTLVMLVGHTA